MSSQFNSSQDNPYAAPTARIDDLTVLAANELASRSTRLGAAILDVLIFVVPVVVVMTFVGSHVLAGNSASRGLLALVGFFALAVVIVNLVFVFRSQQTIGKKICRIKVVRTDGSRCNPWRIILLRGCLTSLLGQIPLIGPLFSLIDALLIFGNDHRCIHDHFAGTIVVRA